MEKGYNNYRLKDTRNNDEQVALDVFEQYGGEQLIAKIKENGTGTGLLSLDERKMASTIIQWLGSHVGKCYIKDFLTSINNVEKE